MSKNKELSPEKILDDHFELIGAEPLKDYQKTFVLDVMQDYATEYAQSILSTKLKEKESDFQHEREVIAEYTNDLEQQIVDLRSELNQNRI